VRVRPMSASQRYMGTDKFPDRDLAARQVTLKIIDPRVRFLKSYYDNVVIRLKGRGT